MTTQKSFRFGVTSQERVKLTHSSLHASPDRTENWNMIEFYTSQTPIKR
jgi:hypothetical protein